MLSLNLLSKFLVSCFVTSSLSGLNLLFVRFSRALYWSSSSFAAWSNTSSSSCRSVSVSLSNTSCFEAGLWAGVVNWVFAKVWEREGAVDVPVRGEEKKFSKLVLQFGVLHETYTYAFSVFLVCKLVPTLVSRTCQLCWLIRSLSRWYFIWHFLKLMHQYSEYI